MFALVHATTCVDSSKCNVNVCIQYKEWINHAFNDRNTTSLHSSIETSSNCNVKVPGPDCTPSTHLSCASMMKFIDHWGKCILKSGCNDLCLPTQEFQIFYERYGQLPDMYSGMNKPNTPKLSFVSVEMLNEQLHHITKAKLYHENNYAELQLSITNKLSYLQEVQHHEVKTYKKSLIIVPAGLIMEISAPLQPPGPCPQPTPSADDDGDYPVIITKPVQLDTIILPSVGIDRLYFSMCICTF